MNSILTAAASMAMLAGPALGTCPESACQTAKRACDSAPCAEACGLAAKAITLTGDVCGSGTCTIAIDCATGQPCAPAARAIRLTNDACAEPGQKVRVIRLGSDCCPEGKAVELTGIAPVAPVAPIAPSAPRIAAAPIAAMLTAEPGGVWVGGGPDEHRSVHYITQSGDQSIEILIEGDDVRAKVNGERVPDDRIKLSDNEVVIYGKDGGVLMCCPLAVSRRGGDDGGTSVGVGASANVGAWNDDDNTFFVSEDEDHPKVMVGINFGSDNGFVWDLVPYDPDEAFVISNVIDGLPAAKAGLRDHDLVVAVDGKRPATPKLLHEVLMSKQPGDTIEFRVFRKGNEKNIEIKLAPYSVQALGQQSAVVAPRVEIRELKAQEQARKAQEQAQMAMERALQALHGQDFDQQRKEVETARKQIEKYFGQLNREQLPNFAVRPDGRQLLFTTPQVDEHVERLQGRLDQLEDRLNGIEDKLDRILDRLDR